MNRLKNYFSSRRLALLHLGSAVEYDRKGQRSNVNHNLIEAVKYLITANNNLRSLAFGQKPKRR